MNNVATQNKNLYNKILRTYKGAQLAWLKLETGKTTQAPKMVIDKLLEILADAIKMIDKIKISSFNQYYPAESIEKITKNMAAHKDQIKQLEKKVMAMKYFDLISPKLGGYVNGIGLGEGEIREYDNKYNLMKQFLTRVLHPHNIKDLEKLLESIGQGVMTLPTFKRWFMNTMFATGMPSIEKLSPKEYAGKYGHPEAWERSKTEFQSLEDYKEEQRQKEAEENANVKFRKKR